MNRKDIKANFGPIDCPQCWHTHSAAVSSVLTFLFGTDPFEQELRRQLFRTLRRLQHQQANPQRHAMEYPTALAERSYTLRSVLDLYHQS